ncbi:toxic anion resistance protein [Peptoniphilus sp. GNH]|nr:toxic anion resistance protein [Peptoniphilus sp. GNH]
MDREIKLSFQNEEAEVVKFEQDSEENVSQNLNLTSDELKMIENFSKQIDLSKTNQILEYGSGAQSQIASFSEKTLSQVKTKDLGEVGKLLGSVVNELKSFDIDEKDGGILKIFKKTSNKLREVNTKYAAVEKNVESISKNLEEHQIRLMKDIATMDQMYDLNASYYKELSMYIMAGEKKLEESKNIDLPKLEEEALKSNSPAKIQEARDLRDSIHRFEKKLHDLDLTRMVSLQMAPQIRMIQGGNTLMVEKIQSTIINTIPLWKSQMVLALGALHTSQAAKAQKAVTDLTNDLLKKNADALHDSTLATTRASEESIIDVDTIKYTNDKLISALKEVKDIQEEGLKRRREATIQIQKLESELKENLIRIAKEK